MRKVLVFQHVAHEILGTLNPLLKQRGFRVRYVNFERHPDLKPSIDKYAGLIVLGGYMGVYEADRYQHIQVELELISQAVHKGIPILGICLGAQMLAHVLGGNVMRASQAERGWCKVEVTPAAMSDPLFQHFAREELVFQMHGDTFSIPSEAVHLASSEVCAAQAFRWGKNIYGLQFHLEADQAMIERCLRNPRQLGGLSINEQDALRLTIQSATTQYLERSVALSRAVFGEFLNLIGRIERRQLLGTDHGKP